MGPASSLCPLGTRVFGHFIDQAVFDVYDSSQANRDHLWKKITFLDYWRFKDFFSSKGNDIVQKIDPAREAERPAQFPHLEGKSEP